MFWCVFFFFLQMLQLYGPLPKISTMLPLFCKKGTAQRTLITQKKKKKFQKLPSLLQMSYLSCRNDIIINLIAQTVHLQ